MSRAGAVGALVTALVICNAATVLAAPQTLHLRGDGHPEATMSMSQPASMSLPDHDNDDDPGRTVKKDSGGSGQSDSTKYQQWSFNVSGRTVSVSTFHIWAAAKDFDDDKEVRFRAYLMDCSSSCTVLAQDDGIVDDGEDWQRVTLELGVNNRDFGAGHSLVLKIVVRDNSEDDMIFAYGTAGYDASLQMDIAAGPSTTTTTTPPSTTTTTKPPATTTTTAEKPATTVGSTTTTDTTSTTTLSSAAVTSTTVGQTPTTEGNIQPSASTDADSTLVPFGSANEGLAAGFESSSHLRPEEGLMVAFETVAETITLYWPAAVGSGSVAAILLGIGLSNRDRRDEEDLYVP